MEQQMGRPHVYPHVQLRPMGQAPQAAQNSLAQASHPSNDLDIERCRMKCQAWIRHVFSAASYCPAYLTCDKALDHTGNHQNDENSIIWSQ